MEGEKFQRRAREFEAIGTLLPAGKRATLEDIWLIDVQSLCHIPHKEDCKYLPCELGVVRYSLNQGIKSKFHRFIRPGNSLDQVIKKVVPESDYATVLFMPMENQLRHLSCPRHVLRHVLRHLSC